MRFTFGKKQSESKKKGRKSSLVGTLMRDWHIWKTLKHCLLFLLLIAYSFAGAALFYFIENPPEQKRIQDAINKSITDRQNHILEIINLTRTTFKLDHLWPGRDEEVYAQGLEELILDYEDELGVVVDIRNTSQYTWTFWNSFYYSFTIYTTIGYGNIYCHTRWCRLATILYALFGIPLVLTVLKYMGQTLFVRASWFWRRLRRLWRKSKTLFRTKVLRERRLSIYRSGSVSSQGTVKKEDLEAGFPLSLAILIILIYIFAMAAVFRLYESKWDYFGGFYFFFITLSTIGLGDQVPEPEGREYLIGFCVVMIGLALVSMCLNVLQNRVEQTYIDALLNLESRFDLGSDLCMDDLEDELEHGNGVSSPGHLPPEWAKIKGVLGILQVRRLTSSRRQSSRRPRVIEVQDSQHGEPVIVVRRPSSRITNRSTSRPLSNASFSAGELHALVDNTTGRVSPSRVRFSDVPDEVFEDGQPPLSSKGVVTTDL